MRALTMAHAVLYPLLLLDSSSVLAQSDKVDEFVREKAAGLQFAFVRMGQVTTPA